MAYMPVTEFPMILGGPERKSGNLWYGSPSAGITIDAATDAGFQCKKTATEDRIVIDVDFVALIDGMDGRGGSGIAAQTIAEELRRKPHRFLEILSRASDAGARAVLCKIKHAMSGPIVESYHIGRRIKRVIVHPQRPFEQGAPPSFEVSMKGGKEILHHSNDTDRMVETIVQDQNGGNDLIDQGKAMVKNLSIFPVGSRMMLYNKIAEKLTVRDIMDMSMTKTITELRQAVWQAMAKRETPGNRSFIAIDVGMNHVG